MATIVNTTPATTESSGEGIGMIVFAVLIIAAAVLFVMYGLPALRMGGSAPSAPQGNSPQINVQLPQGGQGPATGK